MLVKDPAWTREETDYLLELCELFDLRFVIIADRYAVGNLYHLPLVAAVIDQATAVNQIECCGADSKLCLCLA